MALPVLLSTVGTVLNIGGSLLSFFGANRAARRAEREGKRLAEDAIARGEQDVRRYTLDLTRLLGAQRTDIAGQGLDVNFGTAADIRAETERFGAEDVRTIRENAMREAYALRRGAGNQAAQLRTQALGSGLNAFSGTLQLGANAWDVYSRGRARTRAIANTASLDPAWF